CLRSVHGLAGTIHSFFITDFLRLGDGNQCAVSLLLLQHDCTRPALVFRYLHQSIEHGLDPMDGLALAGADYRKLSDLEKGKDPESGFAPAQPGLNQRSAELGIRPVSANPAITTGKRTAQPRLAGSFPRTRVRSIF